MVFPRWGHPHLIDVYQYVSGGEDEDDSPTYSPQKVITGRPGRFRPNRTKADRLVADGVDISGVVVIPYNRGDTITNSDELVVKLREDPDSGTRYKVFTVHRRDLNRRPAFWEIEVVRHG